MQNQTNTSSIGNLAVKMESEICDEGQHKGKLLDTKVVIEGGTICWITGEERSDFIKEINEVIEKYKI